MIELKQFALRRGKEQLFAGASLALRAGARAGIVGRNGCGKSSLLAAIRGVLTADEGELWVREGMRIAHVAQHTPSGLKSALDTVLDGDTELRAIEAELRSAEDANDGERIGRAHARLADIDAYSAPARARQILMGLGFAEHEHDNSLDSFSGGWRMRLNLAQALIARADILALDEPTNHLDLDAVVWLESWLTSYDGTLLVISHDRDFLDAVVNHVVHIESKQVKLYSGNFSSFENQRAAALARDSALAARQAKRRSEIQSFVDRFRAKASKARQVQSRVKALERMEQIELANVDRSVRFKIPEPDKLPNPLLRLDRVTAGYNECPILTDVSISLTPGTRIGLIGHNGAGKSTLIKLMEGSLKPMDGELAASSGYRVGYFAQHQLDLLNADDTPITTLRRADRETPEQALRDHLGGFGFPADMADAHVARLSGGERARLVLAVLVWMKPNVLLLDEPTNHLDLDMRDALASALQDYAGALVTVSHDRHVLAMVTDELWLVHDGKVRPYSGDLTDYRDWLLSSNPARSQSQAPAETAEAKPNSDRRKARQEQAQTRAKQQPLKSRIKVLETEMQTLTQQLETVAASLSEPTIYDEGNRLKLKELLVEQGRLKSALEDAEAEWLEASETLEQM